MRKTTWKPIRALDSDHVLAAIGLQKRRDPLRMPSLNLFAAGAFMGAAAALLLAPKSGPKIRRELAAGAKGLSRRLGTGGQHAAAEANNLPQAVEP